MSQKATKTELENISVPKLSNSTVRQVKVWDILVRVTHWTVAAGVIANLAFTEDGSELHEYVGYTVVALVVIRLLWGLVGSKYARFSDFFPTSKRIKRHLSDMTARRMDSQHLGHNPLGALMMLALWGAIIGLGLTGYLMESQLLGNEDLFEETHELLANSLYFLVPLHILSAIAMSYLQKQNLIKSMVTGNKTVNDTRNN